MVRQVRFQTLLRPSATGSLSGTSSVGMRVSYTHDVHGQNLTDKDYLMLKAPNIEITVPDNWGGSTLSRENVEEGENFNHYNEIGDSIELNIIFMANGNIDKYYQLRDRFMRTWESGEFTLNLYTGNYHGGDQYVNGYLSNISFEEFRTNSNVIGHATFTPTSPWFFQYGFYGNETGLAWGSCPTIYGTIGSRGNGTTLKTNYIAASTITNIGDGMVFISTNYNDPQRTWKTTVTADDFDTAPSYYEISDGFIYAYDKTIGLIGTMSIPDGLISVSMPSDAKVFMLQYAEQYSVLDTIPPGQ